MLRRDIGGPFPKVGLCAHTCRVGPIAHVLIAKTWASTSPRDVRGNEIFYCSEEDFCTCLGSFSSLSGPSYFLLSSLQCQKAPNKKLYRLP